MDATACPTFWSVPHPWKGWGIRSRLAGLGCWATEPLRANRSGPVAGTFHGRDGLPYILVRPPSLEGVGDPPMMNHFVEGL